jgi:hypothetical protein
VPGDGGQSAPQMRRQNMVWAVALLLLAVALPFAIIDTLQTGRVYLFSHQFLDDVARRFSSPGRFRFLLQPTLAILAGVRGGLADARAGAPPYLFGLLRGTGRRRELLRSAGAAIGTLLAMGIILDLVYQVVIDRQVHPGAALLVGPILICAPYSISRALTNRAARWRTGR